MCEGSCCSTTAACAHDELPDMAGNEQVSAAISQGADEEEDMDAAELLELFVCQICLDIAYKPVVLQGCGHAFCFWCVHRSMNETKPSNCPSCRQAYLHFPRVCRLLHFLLQKAWPLHYQRKATETQSMEQTTAIFSPRILPFPPSPASYGALDSSDNYSAGSCRAAHDQYRHAEEEGKHSSDLGKAGGDHDHHRHGEEGDRHTSGVGKARGDDEDHISAIAARKLHVYPELALEAADRAPAGRMTISVDDVTCRACHRLLFRPVVINCGQVLCEACWMKESGVQQVGGSHLGNCLWCGIKHFRGGAARVCLALHHFLERTFPTLYSERRLHSNSSTTPTPGYKQMIQPKVVDEVMEDDDGFVHVGVGCDECGMFPIVGRNRYHCVECGEHMGYDLCKSCYGLRANDVAKDGGLNQCGLERVMGDEESSSFHTSPTSVLSSTSVNGRFDQKHSPKHQMVVMGSTQRALPSIFNVVLHLIERQATPLQFDLERGTISQRRRRTHQQIMDDFDDYIDNFV